MANIRTIDYKGFASASDGTGPKGWMLWSGSEDLSGSVYNGVGMELVAGSESYLKFDASADGAELDIRAKKFFIGTEASQFISGSAGNIEISSSIFHLDPATNTLIIGAGTTINADLSVNNLFVPANTTADTAKAYISSSGVAKFSGDASGNYNVDFTPGTSSISGWTINQESLSSTNLTIDSAGEIRTNDYISNQKGWKIDATEAEFANVKIRGTLSTTVFEKDTISAVGGQVMIANATTYTGSDFVFNGTGNPTHSISVVSTGGWVQGEYVRAKATSSTGFVEEYFKIDSISTDTLHLVRKQGPYYIPTLTDGQVLVSAGLYDNTTNPGEVTQSGYIHLNADPGDASTPYIDIIERTGSGIGDTEVKARLGDLSGIGSLTDPGYGLYSENVFLTGKITATSGQIGGISIASDKLHIGSGNYNDDDTAFYVDNAGRFSLKDKLSWNGTGLSINGQITIGEGSTSAIDFGAGAAASASAAQGTADAASGSAQTGITNAAAAQGTADAAETNAQTGITDAATAQAVADLNAGLIPNAASGLIDFVPTPTGKGLFLGADNLGYYDTDAWSTYMSSSGDFFLKGDGTGGSLAWSSAESKLLISGEIEITNPTANHMSHNFGGPSGSVIAAGKLVEDGQITGSQWYQSPNTSHKTENGTLFVSSSGTGTAWDAELRSKQVFSRHGDHTLVADITITDTQSAESSPRFMIGWGKAIARPSGYSNGTYQNTAHAMYFTDNDIRIYADYESLGTKYSSVSEGDKFRVMIEPNPTAGARYRAFKYPDLTNPLFDYDSIDHTDANTDDILDAGIWALKDTETFHIDSIQVTAPGQQSTVIDGNSISTGKIKSANHSTTQGTEMDLNGEKITFGGSNVGTSTQGLVIDGQNSNLKFYGNSTSSILTIDDNVDGSNPGIKIEDGVLQINRTSPLSGDQAVAYVKQSNSGGAGSSAAGSEDLGLYVGVSDGILDSSWTTYDAVTAASALGKVCSPSQCFNGGTKIGAVIKAEATLATGTIAKNNAIAILADASAYAGYSYSFFGKGKLYNDGGDEGGMFITSSAGHYTAHLKHGSTSTGYVLKLETSNANSNGRFISFCGPNGEGGYIRPDGSGAVSYQTSDIRLKEDIRSTQYGLNDLMKIQVRDFKWKHGQSPDTGFIAQEVYEVLPHAIDIANPDRWYINKDVFIPILVQSVQDQANQITNQQIEIDQLKTRLANIEEILNGLTTK